LRPSVIAIVLPSRYPCDNTIGFTAPGSEPSEYTLT
jgi:hypothetical protein